MKLSRRQFLTAAAGAAIAPTIFVPRKSRAQQQDMMAAARAKQLLILYCAGGMRGHALFSFDGASKFLNPFGIKGSQPNPKVPFRLASPDSGPANIAPFQQTAELLPEWGKQLPTLFGATSEKFSLLGPVDHNPGGPPELDVVRARNLISTGHAEGGPGVLSIIGNHFAGHPDRPLPPFCIGPEATIFGRPGRGLEMGAPVYIHDPLLVGGDDIPFTRVTRPGQGAIDGWELNLRRSLDDGLKARLPTFQAHAVDLVAAGREHTKAVQELLLRPQLRFKSAEFATAAFETAHNVPLSNRRLEQAFLPFIRFSSGGATTSSNFDDPLGARMAMAIRMLQYGAPAVAVGFAGWDLHRDEDKLMHTVSRPLGRALAGLLFVLEGMKRLDEVLVLVVSEWARDGVREDTGFNEHGGSDHRGGPSSRYQILPVFGAGVKGGRVIGGMEHANDLTPLGDVYSSASLAATMLHALGLDSRAHIDADPIEALWD